MKTTSIPLRATVAAALLSLGLAAQAADLVLAPADVTAPAGSSFSLDVNGIGFAGSIIGGDFSVTWDPSRLTLTNRVLDTLVWTDPVSDAGLLDAAVGTLSGVTAMSNALVLPTGNFHVARLDFLVNDAGPTQVRLAASPGMVWANHLVEEVAVTYGLANINAVPEPGTWALMGLGLAAVALRGRKLRAA